jgi:hypothetical protein
VSGPVKLPNKPLDKDLATLARQPRYLGHITQDPETVPAGAIWIRADLDPPELRTQVGDAVYTVEMTLVV